MPPMGPTRPRAHREVLGHPEIGALLQAQALGPLLPPETQRGLERSCIAAVKVRHGGQWGKSEAKRS